MSKTVNAFVDLRILQCPSEDYELFDFERNNRLVTKDKIVESTIISVLNKSPCLLPFITSLATDSENSEDNDETQGILIVEKDASGLFTLSVPEIDLVQAKSVYIPLHSSKNGLPTQDIYSLDIGDVIKIGFVLYKVVEYQDHNGNRFQLPNKFGSDLQKPPGHPQYTKKRCEIDEVRAPPAQDRFCQICLLTESDSPLINPCSCGDMSIFVHVDCLIHKLSRRRQCRFYEGFPQSNWTHLFCEICFERFPDIVEYKDTEFNLFPTPSIPYIIFERVSKRKKETEHIKTAIRLTIEKESEYLLLGRSADCDVLDPDISVSRHHCFIEYEDSRFTVQDNDSKYGTQILLRKTVPIIDERVVVQIGNRLISLNPKDAQDSK